MNLTQELAELTERSQATASPESVAATAETKEAIRLAGLAETALKAGARLPDFALPDASGALVRSADLLARGPLILAFYRGGWCSYCNLELNALRLAMPEIEAKGGTLVAISPELPRELAATAARGELNYTLLSDRGNAFARQLGLVYPLPAAMRDQFRAGGLLLPEINGDDSWELPLPATYLVGKDGVICDAFVDPDYYHRKDPQELIDELAALNA